MDEFGVGRAVEEIDGLRQLEQRRLREQHIACERDDGADRAGIGRLLVAVVVGRLLLLRGFIGREAFGQRQIGLRHAGVERRRRQRVKMPERQHKLNRERKQRKPRTSLDVLSEPIHAG